MPKKLIFDCDEETWKKVNKLKIEKEMKNNNEAVLFLIKEGLRSLDGQNS